MLNQELEMKGRAVLVTGAASGLGRATALKLAKIGANLFLVDVNAIGLDETVSQLAGVAVLAHTADLSDPDACHDVVRRAIAQFGRLDALCNVAGILKLAHADKMSRADWDKIIAINLSAPFFLSQAAIPHLLEVNGAIVNVASFAAFMGDAYMAAYCASKAGLVHMTKAMAVEYIRKPIRINAVAPGGMVTNIGATVELPENADTSLLQRLARARGMVEVDDVADMIVLLATPAGRSYHGTCVSIDAGLTAG